MPLRLLLALLLAAQAAAPTQPRPAPFGGAAERLARVDQALQKYVDDGRVAGIVALVLRDGQPVYERAFGWRDREAGRRMTSDTIFRIASQTKAITSTAILVLMEEGRLGLSDPVSRFIPAFATTTVATRTTEGVTRVAARREITIRDLLTHTAGISYGTGADVAALYEAHGLGPAAGFGWYTADKGEPVCATMERLATLPFARHPGEAWVYGYATDVLGCVVERAAKMPLDAFIRARITGPLGMRDTHFFLAESDRDRLAAVYASDAEGIAARAPDGARGQGHYLDGPRQNFSGGAGLVSTARDYARFLEMVRNGGALDGARILAPDTVALMTTDQVGAMYSTAGLGWSLAFETTERAGARSLDAPGAFGWAGAYGTWYRVDPRSGLTMVLMLQLMPNRTDVSAVFPTLIYQALQDPSK